MPEIRSSTGFKTSLGIVVTRHRPTLRTRVLDAWASFLRRFQ